MFDFLRFAHERRLIGELRKPAPDTTQLTALAPLLADQPRRQALPTGLLCKAETWAEQALRQSQGADAERDRLLQAIHRGALGEVQVRMTHGL